MGCTLTISYPFIRYFPIAIAVSMSHVSGCAMTSRRNTETRSTVIILLVSPSLKRDERETSGYQYRVAPDTAMTGNGAILLSSHSPPWPGDHAMRAAWSDPRRDAIPMERFSRPPPDDFPMSWGVEDK